MFDMSTHEAKSRLSALLTLVDEACAKARICPNGRPVAALAPNLLFALALIVLAPGERRLEYAPAPPDNPLKGFVAYLGSGDAFPHSLEWDYLAVADVMQGPGVYDWSAFDRKLDDAASRGCQFIIRWYLDYPGKPPGTPKWLVDQGVKLHVWTNTNTQPFPSKTSYTPDYEDPRLRKALGDFIAAFGARYDGDPRLAFVPLGLLGTWGEWHNHPRNEWWASKAVQTEVMDAYEAAFKITPLLHRYPAGADDFAQAPNAGRRLGYHDDSFCWATVHTGRKGDGWFFETRLRKAGALDRWMTQPIGGEIRPEVWHTVFADPPGTPEGQDFDRCLAVTCASWLCHHGAFSRGGPKGAVRLRTIEAARRLGYEFHVPGASFPEQAVGPRLPVAVRVENRGVAPFYYPWRVELGILGRDGRVVLTHPTDWSVLNLLPGKPPRAWNTDLPVEGLEPGDWGLALRIVNPLPGGRPLRFANASQDADATGWLTLGRFRRE